MRNLTLSPYVSPEDMAKADGSEKEPKQFLLEDPEGYAPPLVLPVPLAILISMMDGKRTLKEIMDEFTEQTHEPMKLADLKELVDYLDKRRYLDSPSFANFLKNEMNAYARERFRPAAMAGGAYPKEPGELRKMLARIMAIPKKIVQAETPEKDFDGMFPDSVCAAITTHTEPEGGGASYGWTFNAIAKRSEADTFIILGTSHNPMREKFAFSSKSFNTPLGALPVDFEFQKRAVKRFAEKYAALENAEALEKVDLLGDDFVHRDEHSIEFQAIFLKYLAETQKREIRIVPILANTFVPFLAARDVEYPDENEAVRLFLETLSELIQEDEAAGKGKFFIMASSDLAHVGPMFGTPKPVDGELRDKIREKDATILDAIQKTASRVFWQEILKDFNENKISGVAPIYCAIRLLELLGRTGGGRLLSYEQTVDDETKSCVSFGSIVFK